MWNGKEVSVILMTYAERDSIRAVIEGFFDTGLVDEVVVVDNNAQQGTEAEVRRTRARLVKEPQQGYGHATRRGLIEARGEFIVLAEPDGTFLPEDIRKLLVYSAECDVVFGTRTTRELIWAGANMARLLRWGNWAVAKLIEVLFNTSHLSDVGCTYKLLRRDTAKDIASMMTVGGHHAGIEIMLLTIVSGARFVEVPVNYLPRVGISSVTGSKIKAVSVGLRMIVLALQVRRQAPRRAKRPPALAVPTGQSVAGPQRSNHFDSIATVYDDSLPAHVVEHYLRKRTKFVLETCPRGIGLDIGCGTGALATRLANAGYEMVGVDPSEGMLDVLRGRSPAIRAIKSSGTSLPFEDDTYDLALSVAVMHHIAEPGDVRQTLAEMVRVVKPGGRILIWDHNPRNPYWGRLMARVPQDTGEERLIGEREIADGLEAAGAQVLLSRQLGLVPDFTPPRALRVAAAFEHMFEVTPYIRRFAAHNVILASKPAVAQAVAPEPPAAQPPARGTSSAMISPSGSR
jgi:ubiquinone/menaquinone biosynthesis C-methylase UbiE